MADDPQIWDVPLTPAQRWALVQVALDKSAPAIADAAAGKALRRALRAFGLMEIREVLRAHDGKASAEYSAETTPRLHKITRENLDCVLGWRNVARHPAIELDAGDVFDLLEEIKANPKWLWEGSAAAASWGGPLDAYVWDAEKWKPAEADPPAITCPSCGQTFDLSELATAANVTDPGKRAYAGGG